MHTDRIIEALETLTLTDLKRIRDKLDGLIAQIEGWQTETPAEAAPHITYRMEYVKCGKERCTTCAEGPGHGPYWYGYSSEGGRVRKQYIGKQRPED